MARMPVNGIELNVEIQGDGPPLILLHGLQLDLAQWREEAPRLARRFTTVALDCRGHGLSDKPARYALADHVADVLGLMDALGYEAASLYGVSMGSYVAQGVAIASPDRVRDLILTVPKSNGLTSSLQRLMAEHADEIAGLRGRERLKFLAKYIAYNPRVREHLAEYLRSSLTPEQAAAANQALAGFDFRPDLPRVTARTLVVSGRHDGLNPPAEGRLCAELIPGARFVEMEHSGHLPMHEEPERYAAIIDEFLGPGR